MPKIGDYHWSSVQYGDNTIASNVTTVFNESNIATVTIVALVILRKRSDKKEDGQQ